MPEQRLGHAAVPELSLTANTYLTGDSLVRSGFILRDRARSFANLVIERFHVKTPNAEKAAGSLSGGNLQKFIMGREILNRPRVLLVHQPTWGVDVGAAAVIRNSLIRLRDDGAAIIVVSEEIDELFEISDRIAVMYLGRIVEIAEKNELYNNPQHPYTKALLDTVPGIYDESGRTLASIPGIVPENYDQIPGCRFADRCAFAGEGCEKKQEMREIEKDHFVRCHKADRS